MWLSSLIRIRLLQRENREKQNSQDISSWYQILVIYCYERKISTYLNPLHVRVSCISNIWWKKLSFVHTTNKTPYPFSCTPPPWKFDQLKSIVAGCCFRPRGKYLWRPIITCWHWQLKNRTAKDDRNINLFASIQVKGNPVFFTHSVLSFHNAHLIPQHVFAKVWITI